MPIRPENLERYPADWPEISQRIRFERAGGRCECVGECGMPLHRPEGGRCDNEHGKPSTYSGKTVILTTAHLDHTPENCEDDNLKAMCQGCHLWYDREHHAATRRTTREEIAAARENGTDPMELAVTHEALARAIPALLKMEKSDA